MNLSFNGSVFKDLFHSTVNKFLQDEMRVEDDMRSTHNLLAAMDEAIDMMVSADAESTVKNDISADTLGVLEEKDITQIGQYALDLLEDMVLFVESKTGEQDRNLLRLSLPISLWMARRGGKLSNINMVVNSFAGYANEISEQYLLTELVGVIREVIDACDENITKDLEQTDMMRPWRILNLNYGIVATRSHQPALIEEAYDVLVKNLPHDAREFFKEGLQQMDIVGYPDEVRKVVERYNKMWGAESVLH